MNIFQMTNITIDILTAMFTTLIASLLRLYCYICLPWCHNMNISQAWLLLEHIGLHDRDRVTEKTRFIVWIRAFIINIRKLRYLESSIFGRRYLWDNISLCFPSFVWALQCQSGLNDFARISKVCWFIM